MLKIHQLQLSADVDALRRDAKNSGLLESVLSVEGADRHGRWKSRRHHDRDDVQAAKNRLKKQLH